MVQSVCLTSRGSGVRLPLLPPPARVNQSRILKSSDFGIFLLYNTPAVTVLPGRSCFVLPGRSCFVLPGAGSALSFQKRALLCHSEHPLVVILSEAKNLCPVRYAPATLNIRSRWHPWGAYLHKNVEICAADPRYTPSVASLGCISPDML